MDVHDTDLDKDILQMVPKVGDWIEAYWTQDNQFYAREVVTVSDGKDNIT